MLNKHCEQKNISNIIFFILSLLYSFIIIWLIQYLNYFNFTLFWITGLSIVCFSYGSFIPLIEAFMLFATWWLFFDCAGEIFLCLPLISAVILFTGYKAKIRYAPVFILLWFLTGNKLSILRWNFGQYFIFFSTCAMVIIYILNRFNSYNPFKKIDVLYCTYSSNTGHFTKKFIEALKNSGSEVIEHHFHYYNEEAPNLEGDALAVSYPVFGWKAPWHFTSYIINKLPEGKGKPAFLIYTSGGGPENAGLIGWFLLTIKGYKVIGRAWGVYPINVATFRPFPNKIHKYFDQLLPWNQQLKEIITYGNDFSRGKYSGYPVIIWPFFLIIIGTLLDNKWFNVIYRNYAWKRRCTKCGICIKVCPVGRFHTDKNGYPGIKGTCTLCLSCINLCPTNAMQIFGWTEYGRPYKPRWPELLKK